jgi:hypothetical protein
MPNVGIYLSQDVFDALEVRRKSNRPIKLSEVCRSAIEAALGEGPDPSDDERRRAIVERLRASLTPSGKAAERGRRAGRMWAENEATWPDLRSAATWAVVRVEPTLVLRASEARLPYESAVFVDGQQLPHLGGLPSCAEALDSSMYSAPLVEAFWSGFTEGAKEIYLLVLPDMDLDK